MSSLAKRILTGATLVAVVVGLIALRPLAPVGTVAFGAGALLSLLGALELTRMSGFRSMRLAPALPLAALLVALGTWLWRVDSSGLQLLMGGAVVAAVVTAAVVKTRRATAVALAIWATVPMCGLMWIDLMYGTAGLAVLVLLSKIGDIFGYFVGRTIGKRHPFPNLSPGKTVAGCVASLVAGVASGALLGVWGALPAADAGIVAGAIAGLALNLAAQAGDLLESKVKRRAGVKDSSTWVGAAGGVLDVVDSLLLTIPVSLLLWPVLFPFH